MSNDVKRDVGQKDGEAHDLPTEFLDDTDDAHALMFGLWQGAKSLPRKPKYKESFQNPHYHMLGYILGHLLKVVIIVTVGAEFVL